MTIPLTKEQLGRSAGRTTCAMATIDDIGFAAALAKKLLAFDPERYADVHTQLSEKAKKSLQRRKEKHAHEKKLARGKRKPWSFPSQ